MDPERHFTMLSPKDFDRWPVIRNYSIVIIDSLLAIAALVGAFVIRLGMEALITHGQIILVCLPGYLAVSMVTFYFLRIHRGMWRFVSLVDFKLIFLAVSVSVLLFSVITFLINRLDDIPRSLPIVLWMLHLFLAVGIRVTYRIFRGGDVKAALLSSQLPSGDKPVLLIGAGQGTDYFIREILTADKPVYDVLGIVERDEIFASRTIHGVPVLGAFSQLTTIIESLKAKDTKPEQIILTRAPEDFQREFLSELADICEAEDIELRRTPRRVDLISAAARGKASLRPIEIEDLLGRPQTEIDYDAISNFLHDRRVLITGAGGSIGSELVRQVLSFQPRSLVLVENSEYALYAIHMEATQMFGSIRIDACLCDIRDRNRVRHLFKRHRPEVVFHAAALKHVPMVELNPSEGVLTNAAGTRNIADAVREFSVSAMVQISTDKAVNPTNVMGATKRLGEFLAQSLDLERGKSRFMTVRFGNVLGSSGSVVPLFRKQLEAGGPLTVTHPDIKRYFMTIREAVGLVLHASAFGIQRPEDRGQIFVLDMGDPIRIIDIARRLIRLAGLTPDEDIAIKITGLRPGEKLYEELFDDDENRTDSGLEGIISATCRPVPLERLEQAFSALTDAASAGDEARIVEVISDIIPGYAKSSGDTPPDQGARIHHLPRTG